MPPWSIVAGIAEARDSAAGVWAGTELFEALPLGQDSAAEYLVFDDLPMGSSDPASAGMLCRITPESAGEVTFNVRLYLTDLDASLTYEMVGQANVLVTAP